MFICYQKSHITSYNNDVIKLKCGSFFLLRSFNDDQYKKLINNNALMIMIDLLKISNLKV